MDSNRGDDKLITELKISNTEDEEVQPFHYFLGGSICILYNYFYAKLTESNRKDHLQHSIICSEI